MDELGEQLDLLARIRIRLHSAVRLDEIEPALLAGFVRDMSRRHAVTVENSRLQRLGFLAEAGLVLDRSLDHSEALRGLADLTVPELAQLTVIDLLAADGYVHDAVVAAPDARHAREVEQIRREHPLDPDSAHPVARVLRTAQPVLLPEMTPGFQRQIAQGTEHFQLMRRLLSLGDRRASDRASTCARHAVAAADGGGDAVQPGRPGAGRRAGPASCPGDRQRSPFRGNRDLARTLQQSLLPRALPEIPGVQLAARYRAAAEGQDVGGDFYDAFTIGENRWAIAIGDVCGKGADAAALTALARYTIRAIADLGASAECLVERDVPVAQAVGVR